MTEATYELMAPCIGESFAVPVGPRNVELTLAEARLLPSYPGAVRAPFALLFRGPGDLLLPQRIYPLSHARLGRLDLFLVPLGPDQQGHRYEAIFN